MSTLQEPNLQDRCRNVRACPTAESPLIQGLRSCLFLLAAVTRLWSARKTTCQLLSLRSQILKCVTCMDIAHEKKIICMAPQQKARCAVVGAQPQKASCAMSTCVCTRITKSQLLCPVCGISKTPPQKVHCSVCFSVFRIAPLQKARCFVG